MGNIHGVYGASRRLMIRAGMASVSLSVLFMVVYSSTNWLTSQRTDVGTWYFDWERFIPFVPLMVIPYMSIDLFFVGGPFICRDERELKTFSRRIVLAILLAGVCFLIMPLQLAFERPQLEGLLGALFGWFFAADLPYNLCPSLHIALRTILADTYARHTSGSIRIASHVWFSLIGFSTLLTYQHHVIDVVGGFLLATICFYAIASVPHRHPVIPNRRVGSYYLLAALAAGFVAVWLWPWAGIMLWPAAACLLATMAYFGLGPGIYRKVEGRLTLSTRLLLAPLLIGQNLSLWYYRRQCRAWDEVTPHIWIGRKLSDSEADDAIRKGVTAVLDLTTEFSEAAPFRATRYLNVPILDLTAPTPEQLEQCIAFLSENTARGTVYVHCKIGYSRTAAVVGAYLMSSGAVPSATEAMSHLRDVRPSIVIRPEAVEALHSFENNNTVQVSL
ncbi:MAG: dual specificity protein phosphatase family protein [Pirellulales bacterium]|nr:dual specificity protein phosphatase family protein [Pirellulales bacterium]